MNEKNTYALIHSESVSECKKERTRNGEGMHVNKAIGRLKSTFERNGFFYHGNKLTSDFSEIIEFTLSLTAIQQNFNNSKNKSRRSLPV